MIEKLSGKQFFKNFACVCRQVYDKASPGYRGRCTAPLLLDKKTKKIISSESPEILATLFRMQLPGCTDIDLAPPELESESNELKAIIYNQVLQSSSHYLCLEWALQSLC